MDRTIIVTGANGYLGTYICKQLLAEGYNVLALKYGVALWDGHVDPEQIEEVYQYWIKNIK